MRAKWIAGLKYGLLACVTVLVLLLGAAAPGLYVAYRDEGYFGVLEADDSEQSSYSYQGSLRNKADTLTKWLSAAPDVTAAVSPLEADAAAYWESLERDLLCSAPDGETIAERVSLQHLNYPSGLELLRLEGDGCCVYIDEKTGKALRIQARLPQWLRGGLNEEYGGVSPDLVELLPNLANAYARHLGLNAESDLLSLGSPFGNDPMSMYNSTLARFSMDQRLQASILVSRPLDMVLITLESGDGT